MTIMIICGILLFFISLFTTNAKKDSKSDKVFFSLFSILLTIGMFLVGLYFGDYVGQTRALRGKFDYKMEVKYELKDSVYTPVDTTFIEIKH